LKPNISGWKRRMFKKNKVWVATDPEGNALVYKNKVLIKYQLDQDYEYWVHPGSIHDIPDADSTRKQEQTKPSQKNRALKDKPNTGSQPAGMKNRTVIIYTDGASSGNPGPSGIGVVMQHGGQEREISKFIGHTTNSVAELTAVQIALQSLKRKDLPVRLYTDSSYVYNLLMSGWKARKNIPLVCAIKKLMAQFADVQIFKVQGHAGVIENERADRLATSAIRSFKKSD
jgi:ribonuclease HI